MSGLDPLLAQDNLTRVLIVLQIEKDNGNLWLSAVDISTILRTRFGIRLHWKSINAVLYANPQLSDRRKRSHRWQFSILKKGSDHITGGTSSIVLVDPTNALQSVITLHAFMQSFTGQISICDPYVDPVTFEHLDACGSHNSIRLLTRNINKDNLVRRMVSASRTQGRALDVRIASTAVLHDRYMIDSSRIIILGTSLNGFGKKQCLLIPAGPDIRRIMLSEFDREWNIAGPFV